MQANISQLEKEYMGQLNITFYGIIQKMYESSQTLIEGRNHLIKQENDCEGYFKTLLEDYVKINKVWTMQIINASPEQRKVFIDIIVKQYAEKDRFSDLTELLLLKIMAKVKNLNEIFHPNNYDRQKVLTKIKTELQIQLDIQLGLKPNGITPNFLDFIQLKVDQTDNKTLPQFYKMIELLQQFEDCTGLIGTAMEKSITEAFLMENHNQFVKNKQEIQNKIEISRHPQNQQQLNDVSEYNQNAAINYSSLKSQLIDIYLSFMNAELIGQRYKEINHLKNTTNQQLEQSEIDHRNYKVEHNMLRMYFKLLKKSSQSIKQDIDIIQKFQQHLGEFQNQANKIVGNITSNSFLRSAEISSTSTYYYEVHTSVVSNLKLNKNIPNVHMATFNLEKNLRALQNLQNEYSSDQQQEQQNQQNKRNLRQQLETANKVNEEARKKYKKIQKSINIQKILKKYETEFKTLYEKNEEKTFPEINYYSSPKYVYVIDTKTTLNKLSSELNISNSILAKEIVKVKQEKKQGSPSIFSSNMSFIEDSGFLTYQEIAQALSNIKPTEQEYNHNIIKHCVQKRTEIANKPAECQKEISIKDWKKIVFKDWIARQQFSQQFYQQQNYEATCQLFNQKWVQYEAQLQAKINLKQHTQYGKRCCGVMCCTCWFPRQIDHFLKADIIDFSERETMDQEQLNAKDQAIDFEQLKRGSNLYQLLIWQENENKK